MGTQIRRQKSRQYFWTTIMAAARLLLVVSCWLPNFYCAELSNHDFGNRVLKGQVTNPDLNYITGIAASQLHKNILWMATSREAQNALYAVDVDSGKEVAVFNLTDAAGYDWEDLAYGPCVDDCANNACGAGKPVSRYCIYIADVGNHGNDGAHDKVYMVREPDNVGDGQSVMMGNISVVDDLTFSWSEPDAETLMVSPEGQLYVMSKIDGGRAMLAQIPDSGWGGNHVVIDETKTGIMKVLTSHHDPQGGAISPGGTEMIIACEDDVYYYSITDGDYINAVRTQIPQRIANYVKVRDNEAIAWAPEAKGIYTFARNKNQFIYYYHRATSSNVVG